MAITRCEMKSADPMKEFDLSGIRPWGRRLSEYCAFFGLDDLVSNAPILDAAGGPSPFNAEATALGTPVVSVDPIYELDETQIRQTFMEDRARMRAGLHNAAYRFTWSFYGSEEKLYRMRDEALELFLADFRKGKEDGRYVTASLPDLPFPKDSFKLALSSHFLFLYSDELDSSFHVTALEELLRVSQEVRAFPLLNMDGLPSCHLGQTIESLSAAGFNPELLSVPFEFQLGATQMLRVRR
jgi:hypothetical protein